MPNAPEYFTTTHHKLSEPHPALAAEPLPTIQFASFFFIRLFIHLFFVPQEPGLRAECIIFSEGFGDFEAVSGATDIYLPEVDTWVIRLSLPLEPPPLLWVRTFPPRACFSVRNPLNCSGALLGSCLCREDLFPLATTPPSPLLITNLFVSSPSSDPTPTWTAPNSSNSSGAERGSARSAKGGNQRRSLYSEISAAWKA